MRYRVTRTWIVEASDENQARDLALNEDPWMETVHSAELPEGRVDVQEYYEQPLDVLDSVWDEYMDRSLPPDITNSVRLQLPTLVELSNARVDPQKLSLLFDCAISAYQRSLRE
jgi:hypothetical protein